jgi:alkanesulfonate monooxygenase SsuD/methylene tetrahydromethanopterin reductase-like flavin-dependent oxidoreductase (luciferase family)
MNHIEFGISLAPAAADLDTVLALTQAAEAAGLELLGIQDHPYVAEFADTLALAGHLLSATERIRVFPDVANLPLRAPAMLAKTAATLDLLSGGRFELGLGAGASQRAVHAMGGPARTRAEALPALTEGIQVIRALWQAGQSTHAGGEHYRIDGVHAGPAPAHPIGIWLGAVGPRALQLTGRVADGWAAPIPNYLAYEARGAAQDRIDDAAREAGRDPQSIRRLLQLPGTITDERDDGPPTGNNPILGPPARWVEAITHLVRDLRFDTVIFWPETPSREQLNRYAGTVVPAVRENLAATG